MRWLPLVAVACSSRAPRQPPKPPPPEAPREVFSVPRRWLAHRRCAAARARNAQAIRAPRRGRTAVRHRDEVGRHAYGGYLALTAVRAFPERVRGAATLGAITDFVGFLEGTAAYRRDHRRAEYGDESEPAMRDFLTKISPLAHVAEIQRPLLMAYGLRDPRVPPATADRFIRAARAAGVRVWSVAAADEGHWFEEPANRRVFEVLLVQFLRSLEQ